MPVTRASNAVAAAKPVAPAAPAPTDKVEIELTLYRRYMLKNTLYEKGVIYTFQRKDADVLLKRSDPHNGLPIFRVYQPPKPKVVVKRNPEGRPVVDMTAADLPPIEATPPSDRLDIGTMEELEAEGISVESDEDAVEV